MPTVTAVKVQGYAHCRDARCPGYHQETVDAIREEASYTFGENGGDGVFTHMTESSRVEYRAAEGDAPCPVCSIPREITGDPRPQYINESGKDPLGLLKFPKYDPAKQFASSESTHVQGETDGEIEARLRAKLREEQIEARLRAEAQE